MVKEGLELDFLVAEDIRVGGPACPVFGKEMFKYPVPVFRGKVGGVQFDAKNTGHLHGVQQVFAGGAILGAVVLVPVLHEQAFDLVASVDQSGGRDGGIHTAGHADDHMGVLWGFCRNVAHGAAFMSAAL